MANKSLNFIVGVQDRGANKTLDGMAGKSESTTKRISGAFSKLGGVLGGEVGDLLDKTSEGFDKLGEAGGSHLSEKLAVGGGALLGFGGALTMMGAKEKQASDQLASAIENTGHSAEEFDGDIEKVVGQMENLGHSAVDSKDALMKLTNATHDPKQAIDLMGEAADLAASKHISLGSAADMVARIIAGKGTRTMAAYNIALIKNKDGTTNWTATNQKLAEQLSGQASASVDNFGGKLDVLKTKIEDQVAEVGQKWGPAITAAGAGMLVLSPIVSGAGKAIGALKARFGEAGAAATTAAEETAAADEEIVVSNEAAAASAGELAAAEGEMRIGMLGAATGIGVFAVAAYMGGNAIGKWLDGPMRDLIPTIGNATEAVDNWRDALEASNGALTDNIRLSIGKKLQDTGVAQQAAYAGVSLHDLEDAVTGNDAAMQGLIKRWVATGKASIDGVLKLGELHHAYGTATDKARELAGAQDKGTTALERQAEQFGTTSDALTAAKQAVDKQTESQKAATLQMQLASDAAGLEAAAFDKLNAKTLDAKNAELQAKDAVAALNDAQKQNGSTLDENTAKGRANTESILSAITAAQSHAEAVGKETGSTDKASQAYKTDIGWLKEHAKNLGYNGDKIDSLIKKYGKLPPVKKTKVDMIDEATARITDLENHLDKLTGQTWMINVDAHGTYTGTTIDTGHGTVRFNAGGTDDFPGGRTWINEREPEIVDLPRGTKITPASRMSSSRAGGGGSPVVHLTVHVRAAGPVTASREMGEQLGRHLEVYLGSGGRIRGIN